MLLRNVHLACTITIEDKDDTYYVSQQYLDELNPSVFGVTSKGGIDTIANGLSFPYFDKALDYVRLRIRTRIDDEKSAKL